MENITQASSIRGEGRWRKTAPNFRPESESSGWKMETARTYRTRDTDPRFPTAAAARASVLHDTREVFIAGALHSAPLFRAKWRGIIPAGRKSKAPPREMSPRYNFESGALFPIFLAEGEKRVRYSYPWQDCRTKFVFLSKRAAHALYIPDVPVCGLLATRPL